MAAGHTLETELSLKNAQAVRAAKEVVKHIDDFGNKADGAGKKAAAGMTLAGRATATFGRQILALGASYLSLTALISTIRGVVAAYENAIRLRDKFAAGQVGMLGQLAGMAGQFGITEPQALGIAGPMALEAGVPPGQVGQMGDLLMGMRSVGLLGPGDITAAGAGPGVGPMATLIAQWAQQKGAMGQVGMITRLTSAMMGGADPTRANVARALGQIGVGFRESESSNWSNFLRGGVGGVIPLAAAGVAPETAMAQYSALVATRARERGAGELTAQLARRYAADDPAMMRLVGGQGAYWRAKRADPDALYRNIMRKLVAVEGPAAQALYQRLGFTNEEIERLNLLRSRDPVRAAILDQLIAASGEGVQREATAWRRGPRAKMQAVETAGELAKAAAARIDPAILGKMAATERELLGAGDAGISFWAELLIPGAAAERRYYVKQALRRQYRAIGLPDDAPEFDWTPYTVDGDILWSMGGGPRGGGLTTGEFIERFPNMGRALGRATGTTVINAPNITNQYNMSQTPGNLGENNQTRGGVTPGAE